MGQLDGQRAVQFSGRLASVAKTVEDDKQIIPRPVNIVQPKVDSNQITGAVVLEEGAGQPLSAKSEIQAVIDLMEGHRLCLGQLDPVDGIGHLG